METLRVIADGENEQAYVGLFITLIPDALEPKASCNLVKFDMLINLAIASLMMLFTTGLHVAGLSLVMFWIKAHAPNWRHRNAFARARNIGGVALLMFCLSIAEAFAWAVVYLLVGVFEKVEPALYFSVVTLTTLGFGDVLLDERYRLMAAFEAVNGIIIFGLTTAAVVAVVQVVYAAGSSG